MANDQAPHATITAAHTVTETLRIALSYPDHQPREDDPHYKVFHKTRERLERLGQLVCWIGNADCAGDIELHHALIEDALINDVDKVKVHLDHPVFNAESDDEFLDWCQSEGNLLCLCRMHHIGCLGIHANPYPGWVAQRYLKDGVAAPSRRVQ